MKVVYIDVLFFVNWLMNCALLMLTAHLAGVGVKGFKICLGASLGGIFSVALFFAPPGAVINTLFKVLLCGGVVSVTFGKRSRWEFFRLSLIFSFVTFAMGGVVFMASMTGLFAGQMENGVVYINISPIKLVLVGAITYFLVYVVMGKGGFVKKGELVDIRAVIGGKTFDFVAMVDTGNSLEEPITKKEIIVVSPSVVGMKVGDDVLDYFQVGIFAIPCKTATGNDLLYAIKPTILYMDGKESEGFLIGISKGEINAKQGVRALCPPIAKRKNEVKAGFLEKIKLVREK